MKLEALARESIDAALAEAGWAVQDVAAVNLGAGRGVAIREFPFKKGHGSADYLLYVDRKAVGAIEAKKEGEPLTGVETQTAKYGDRQVEAARAAAGLSPDQAPTPEQIQAVADHLLERAAQPIAENAELRRRLIETRQRYEQTIDTLART